MNSEVIDIVTPSPAEYKELRLIGARFPLVWLVADACFRLPLRFMSASEATIATTYRYKRMYTICRVHLT